MDSQMDRWIDGWMDRQMERQICRLAYRQASSPLDKLSDRWKDREQRSVALYRNAKFGTTMLSLSNLIWPAAVADSVERLALK
jgi:hypothetical protein